MSEASEAKEGLEKTSLSVGGMSCAACVVTGGKGLGGIGGGGAGRGQFRHREGPGGLRPPGRVDLARFREVIEEAGYQFRGIDRADLRDREQEETGKGTKAP